MNVIASGRRAIIATVVVVAFIGAAAVFFVARYWGVFKPTDATSAWSALGTVANGAVALCTLALVVFSVMGLRSLRITRDEIIHRAKREATLCAIQRLEEIAKEIVPQNTKVLDALANDGLTVFLGPHESVQFEPDPSDISRATEWYRSLSVPSFNGIVSFLNRLEAWSVYFTTGIADSDVAFDPIAPLLRSWVGQYYAVLLVLRSGDSKTSGKFPNLIKLYGAWSARMDAQQINRMHQDIAGQMEQAKRRLDQANARLEQSKLPDVVPKIGQ